jgi:Fe-S cluster assembly protein SufD
MHRDAQKSDSHQLIRNLLLSETARIYARPQLKIYADDVKASHGAATGQLNEAELFYLRSRGLREKTARFLLTYGFAEEIVEQIEFALIRSNIEETIRRQIEKMTE